MPNWIYNRLTVTGEADALGDFMDAAESSEPAADTGRPDPLDFESHVPTPPELIAAPIGGRAAAPARAPGGDDRWFYWRNEHWGTKWNAMWPERTGEAASGRVVYTFSTAWAPPEPWLARVSTAHPELSFALEFVEEFCQAAGGVRWIAGELAEQWPVDPLEAEWVDIDENDEDDEDDDY